jgi:hypothetical protein
MTDKYVDITSFEKKFMIISVIIFILLGLVLKPVMLEVAAIHFGSLIILYPISNLITMPFTNKNKLKWYYHIFAILWVNLLSLIGIFILIAIEKNASYLSGSSDEVYLMQIVISIIIIVVFKNIKSFLRKKPLL